MTSGIPDVCERNCRGVTSQRRGVREREVRKRLCDGIVEIQLATLDELHDRHRHEWLRHRREVEDVPRCEPFRLRQGCGGLVGPVALRHAVRAGINDLPIADDRRGEARNPALFDLTGEIAINSRGEILCCDPRIVA